jgi:hypothetical protein
MHKSRSEVEEKVSKIERSLLEMQKVIREVTEQQAWVDESPPLAMEDHMHENDACKEDLVDNMSDLHQIGSLAKCEEPKRKKFH